MFSLRKRRLCLDGAIFYRRRISRRDHDPMILHELAHLLGEHPGL